MIYAQDANFWNSGKTTLAESIGEAMTLFDKFNAGAVGYEKKRNASGVVEGITIAFSLAGRQYTQQFHLLPLDMARATSKRVTRNLADFHKLAENQMGRLLVWWLKTALMMACELGHEEVLAPYLMLPASTPDGKRIATTIQQQGAEWMLTQAQSQQLLALPAPSGYKEVD